MSAVAKEQTKKAERVARNLAQAAQENAQLGLPRPFKLNGIWLVPLGAGRVKPITPRPWRRPRHRSN